MPARAFQRSGSAEITRAPAFLAWPPPKRPVTLEALPETYRPVLALALSPDGNAVVFADGATVRIANEAIANSWHAHADAIMDLAVGVDGRLLATAGSDKLVKVWDLATGKALATLEGHTAQVLTVAFEPTAERLVSGGADQQLTVWDVKTKERIGALGTHTAAISAVTWTPSAIFAATERGALLRCTDLQAHDGTQRSDAGKERKLESADTTLHAITASSDGQRVFAGSHDGRIFAWNKDGKVASRDTAVPAVPPKEPARKDGITFLRDVLPVLSKAGCNAGACHAKPDGQNGFHLTVFSYDPRSEFAEITQQARSRRIFPAALDPAAQVFAKGAKQPLRVEAHYSDGSKRDVTALADFASNDKEIARAAESGVVSIGRTSGQAVIVARFMGLVADARITVPADHLLPAERYAALPRKNFIDELAYSHVQQLGLSPRSGLPVAAICEGGNVFLEVCTRDKSEALGVERHAVFRGHRFRFDCIPAHSGNGSGKATPWWPPPRRQPNIDEAAT